MKKIYYYLMSLRSCKLHYLTYCIAMFDESMINQMGIIRYILPTYLQVACMMDGWKIRIHAYVTMW